MGRDRPRRHLGILRRCWFASSGQLQRDTLSSAAAYRTLQATKYPAPRRHRTQLSPGPPSLPVLSCTRPMHEQIGRMPMSSSGPIRSCMETVHGRDRGNGADSAAWVASIPELAHGHHTRPPGEPPRRPLQPPAVQVMTGPLFLVTVSRLTAVLDCTALPGPVRRETGTAAVLDTSLTYSEDSNQPLWDTGRSTWVPCFEGSHQEQLAATMVGLLFFLPSATMASAYFEVLTPPGLHGQPHSPCSCSAGPADARRPGRGVARSMCPSACL